MEFNCDSLKTGEDPSAPYALSHAVGSVGTHQFFARPYDQDDKYNDSSTQSLVVTQAPASQPPINDTNVADETSLLPGDTLHFTVEGSDQNLSFAKYSSSKCAFKMCD